MKLYTAFSTFPSIEVAREVSRELVEKKLVACVNLLPAVESIYQWKGKVCEDTEVLAVMKFPGTNLDELRNILIEIHPYDVPEFIVFEIEGGNQDYLDWVASSAS